VWPDPLLETRLKELLAIVRDRLVVAPGVMHMYAHPDWTPVPGLARYGQILRSANLLFGAAAVLGEPTTARVTKSMVDTMLRIAWDRKNGGFYLAGSSFGPAYVEDNTVFLSDKVWWLQAEGLTALLTMAHEHPDDAADYSKRFADLWMYLRRYMIDMKRGGWLSAGLDGNRAARKRPKATMWKDCSHETEALLYCLHILETW
jgi:mannobiose 2-epimerase